MSQKSRLSQSINIKEEKQFVVFSGSSSKILTQSICEELEISPGKIVCGFFRNGETSVEIMESVRGLEVFLVQTGCEKINNNLIELLIMIHSCKYASASKITAVIPCYFYARQDKKDRSRAPITAKLVADLITCAGADHVITMDLHASQIQGFFSVPLDNLLAEPLFIDWIVKNVPNYKSAMLVSPDAGGVKRVSSAADILQMEFVMIHKERHVANQVSSMIIVGNVAGKDAIMIDDMADTCGTTLKAVEKLKEAKAKRIYVLCVHGIFSGDAVEQLKSAPIDMFVVTNTIDNTEKLKGMDKVKVIDVGPTFAETIRRNLSNESISELFFKPFFKKGS